MKQIIVLITFLTINSCSVFKHKTELSSSVKEFTVHTFSQKDSLQLREEAQHIGLLYDDQLELIEIIPTGTFVYQGDSGFTGTAASVRILRQRQQRSIERDTSALSLTNITNRKGADSIVHHQQKRQVEETKKSKPLGFWVYLVVALGMLGVVLYLFISIKKHS